MRSLQPQEVKEAQKAVATLCRLFGKDGDTKIHALRLTVGELIEADMISHRDEKSRDPVYVTRKVPFVCIGDFS